jgi:cytochrome P450
VLENLPGTEGDVVIESRDLGAIDFGAEPLPDLHAVLARARETAPVVRVRFFGDPAWLITRHADVAEAFADEETMPAAAAYSLFAEPVQGRTLQCMTGDEHRVNRALVSPAFRPSAVRGLVEPLLRPLARDLAAELAGRAESEGRADLVGDFAARYPFLVITRLLGLEGGAVPRLREWATALFSYTTDPDAATAGAARFTGFLRRLISERRAALLSRRPPRPCRDGGGPGRPRGNVPPAEPGRLAAGGARHRCHPPGPQGAAGLPRRLIQGHAHPDKRNGFLTRYVTDGRDGAAQRG